MTCILRELMLDVIESVSVSHVQEECRLCDATHLALHGAAQLPWCGERMSAPRSGRSEAEDPEGVALPLFIILEDQGA